MPIVDLTPTQFAAQQQKHRRLSDLLEQARSLQLELVHDAVRHGLAVLVELNVIPNLPESLPSWQKFNEIAPHILQIANPEIKSYERACDKLRKRFGKNCDLDETAQYLYDVTRLSYLIGDPDTAEKLIAKWSSDTQIVDHGWRILPPGYIDRQIIVKCGNVVSEIRCNHPALYRVSKLDHTIYDVVSLLTGTDHKFPRKDLSALDAVMFTEQYNAVMQQFATFQTGSVPQVEASQCRTAADLEKRYLELVQLQRSIYSQTVAKLPSEWQRLYRQLAEGWNVQPREENEIYLPIDVSLLAVANTGPNKAAFTSRQG